MREKAFGLQARADNSKYYLTKQLAAKTDSVKYEYFQKKRVKIIKVEYFILIFFYFDSALKLLCIQVTKFKRSSATVNFKLSIVLSSLKLIYLIYLLLNLSNTAGY